MAKYTLIVLPLNGEPKILDNNFDINKEKALATLQEHVGGFIEFIPNPGERIIVHPMFEETPAWKQASKLLKKAKKNSIEVYCNENGMKECSPNMALFLKGWSGLQPIFGNVVIKINNKWFNKNKKNYKAIKNEE